jgi:hypothetical protein
MSSAGVVFPVSGGSPNGTAGRTGPEPVRSTSALGRTVVADALRRTDPVGARAAAGETNWRRGYVTHFRRLIEAGLASDEANPGDAERAIATDGLASLHERMRFVGPDGSEVSLAEAVTSGPTTLGTEVVEGRGVVDRTFSLPYRGERLRGDALTRQLDSWIERGVVEPSCANAVREVVDNPDWLDLSDLRIVAVGAGAEMGPVHSLLRWGADVVALDLPRPAIWSRLFDINARFGGRLRVPVAGGDDRPLPDRAGADLLHDLPAVTRWLSEIDGRLVLGNYVYADGATNVRVSTAVDALSVGVQATRPDTGLAFLATPTDAFAVPPDAVAQAELAYRNRSGIARVRQPLRMLSAGRLLRRNYAPGSDPGICDSIVPQQGPNYALAKRLQRWRATDAHAAGALVSFHVAPPTRTRSVVKNRALAAAYAGAHLFGVEVFEPATSNTLMAALLVHDLRNPRPASERPWQDEAYGAAHGGLWRAAYSPRSALGLAALLGFGGARG